MKWPIVALILICPVTSAYADDSAHPDLSILCFDVVGEGWNHMQGVTDYVEAQPGAEKLGFGSECHIDSLVFSQCWLKPKWTIFEAINALLRKASLGKKLPDVPACGA